jgi:hypothetical protein
MAVVVTSRWAWARPAHRPLVVSVVRRRHWWVRKWVWRAVTRPIESVQAVHRAAVRRHSPLVAVPAPARLRMIPAPRGVWRPGPRRALLAAGLYPAGASRRRQLVDAGRPGCIRHAWLVVILVADRGAVRWAARVRVNHWPCVRSPAADAESNTINNPPHQYAPFPLSANDRLRGSDALAQRATGTYHGRLVRTSCT